MDTIPQIRESLHTLKLFPMLVLILLLSVLACMRDITHISDGR